MSLEPPFRFDPTLGRVRLCGTCGEEWPFDSEFWHIVNDDLSPAWPRRCVACCAEYYASRRRLAMDVARAERVYLIPDPERCGRPMKFGRTCGRAPGHKDGCRSIEAMVGEADRKRSGRAA